MVMVVIIGVVVVFGDVGLFVSDSIFGLILGLSVDG